MKYDQRWLLNELDQGQKFKYLFFWGNEVSRDGSITASSLSQWWEGHPFTEASNTYLTAEHYMMAGKARLFGDEENLAKILQAVHPAEAKKLGRQVRNFRHETWLSHRCEIVIRANQLKFSQHPALKEFLLNTQDRILVEASPYDQIWGIGLAEDHAFAAVPEKWQGINLLGFCLMEVRDTLRQNSQ
jgi:ribA/ribD-fused uncharacterized protein